MFFDLRSCQQVAGLRLFIVFWPNSREEAKQLVRKWIAGAKEVWYKNKSKIRNTKKEMGT